MERIGAAADSGIGNMFLSKNLGGGRMIGRLRKGVTASAKAGGYIEFKR